MFNKFFIALFIFVNFIPNLYADNRKLIIDKLKDINNITFDFEQITNNKKEFGTCVLSFNNKLSCDYIDSMHKRVLINGKRLIVQHKRYDKIYFYPISNSLFVQIFNKKNLISLIKDSSYQLNENIELTYFNEEKQKIIIYFEKITYDLVGWQIVDRLQNVISFSIKIKDVNSQINPKISKVPSRD